MHRRSNWRFVVAAPSSPRVSVCALVLLLMLTGCAADQWSVFEVDWQKRLDDQAQRRVEMPDHLRPTPTDTTVPIPEGDGPLALSVEQAVLLALRNNRDLAVQQLSPVIVGAFEQIERGLFDPELFAEFAYSEDQAVEASRSTGERFGVTSDGVSAVAGVRQRLPTGTDVEATVSHDRSISSRSPELQEARLGLTITQSLLEGFGPAVNLARIRQAQLGTLASEHELRGFTEALLAETEIAYWHYTLAETEIEIFERSLDLAKRQRDEAEQRIEVGVLARTEAAAVRAEVALREQQLIDARSTLEAQRLRLLRLLNAGPAAITLERQVHATSDPRLKAMPITDSKERLQLAQRFRPDLNEARMRLEQDRLETIVTRNGLLPRLDLFVALGKSGFDDRFDRSFGDIDGPAYDFVAGARFSHMLGNRADRGRDVAARATRQQSAAAIHNLTQLVDLDVRLAINEAERSRQQIDATAATRVLQEETFDAERQRFEVGASTALLVAQAQRDLLASQIAEVETIVNYRVALVRLYLAEGSLLERRGLRLGQAQGRHGAPQQGPAPLR